MKKIAVLFSGIGTNFEYLIQNLPSYIRITLALCNNPSANGISIAQAHNIPVLVVDSSKFETRELFDETLVYALKEANVDLVVLAGFMRILTSVFTKNIKSINLHPSLLPRHKGTNAIAKSYHDEYPEGGVSVHYVTDELDGGEIILQKEIYKDDLSFDEYYQAIKKAEKEALLEAVLKILK